MKPYSRINAVIDLSAIEYNFEQMYQNLNPGTKILAVIKADGYGHGSVPIAKLIEKKDYIWGYAVATAEEGFHLRKHGLKKPILLLGYAFPEHYEQMIQEEIRCCVFKMDTAMQLSELSVRLGKNAKIHFALDTGMTRIGYSCTDKSVDEMVKISQFEGIEVEGMFTHFARADEIEIGPAYNQFNKYMDMLKRIADAGLNIPIRHCCNSAGIIRMRDANLDMVRAGISIYGMYPSDEVEKEPVDLQPAMSVTSHIAYIKNVDAGVEISYGGTYKTEKEMRVATIPVGYADGYPRQLSNKGYVLICGKKAPILGRICMDQFMVDVSDIPEAEEGALVTLVGKDLDACIRVEELSQLCGRFNYEFVCDITKRVPRTYIYNGVITEQIDYFDM